MVELEYIRNIYIYKHTKLGIYLELFIYTEYYIHLTFKINFRYNNMLAMPLK